MGSVRRKTRCLGLGPVHVGARAYIGDHACKCVYTILVLFMKPRHKVVTVLTRFNTHWRMGSIHLIHTLTPGFLHTAHVLSYISKNMSDSHTGRLTSGNTGICREGV